MWIPQRYAVAFYRHQSTDFIKIKMNFLVIIFSLIFTAFQLGLSCLRYCLENKP